MIWCTLNSMPFPFIQNNLFNLLDFPGYSLLVNEYQSAFYSNSFEVCDNDFVLSSLRGICLFLLPFLSPFFTTTSKDMQYKRRSNKRAFLCLTLHRYGITYKRKISIYIKAVQGRESQFSLIKVTRFQNITQKHESMRHVKAKYAHTYWHTHVYSKGGKTHLVQYYNFI